MPNRMIYVSANDVPLYERVQQLSGGNLSATVTQALRRYVETEEARAGGHEVITLPVGRGARHMQRFHGVLLGEWRISENGNRLQKTQLYRTRKSQYVVYTRSVPDWADWKIWVNPSWGDTGKVFGGLRSFLGLDWSEHSMQAEATLEVVDSMEELEGRIPAEFYEALKDAERQDAVIEELDI